MSSYVNEFSSKIQIEKAKKQYSKSDDLIIKNIDDPSSDEDEDVSSQKCTAKSDNTTETVKRDGDEQDDTDDFILIGSWFEDQLNSEEKSSPTAQEQSLPVHSKEETLNKPMKNFNEEFDISQVKSIIESVI